MKLQIENTNQINGTINISGSKNACLPILVTCLLTNQKMKLYNVPNITDITYMLRILKSIGVKVKYNKDTNELLLKRKYLKSNIKSTYTKKIRASYYLIGALFTEKKTMKTKYPGGCNFEERPIDYHLEAINKMGGKICTRKNIITIKRKQKIPTTIKLKTKSVGATINIILASVKTIGTTTILNPSLEPEVLDFINVLIKMGSMIEIKKDKIIIKGVKKLKGTSYRIMSDRIEAGSYLFLASSVVKSNVLLNNINPSLVKNVINQLSSAGVDLIINKDSIRVLKNQSLNYMKVIADDYPNFPTDLQQIATAALLSSNKISLVQDNIYKNRFSEVNELIKMNAKIIRHKNKIIIFPSRLIGTTVTATDLRAGFALIVAGANAEGVTIIENAQVIFRGYEHLILKLKNLNINAKIIL